jgi:transcriptional antiterminator RfaH
MDGVAVTELFYLSGFDICRGLMKTVCDMINPLYPAPDRMPSEVRGPSSHGVIQFPSPNTHGLIRGSVAVPSVCRWFVVQSRPRQERVALINLERQGYESYLPLFAVQKMVRRKLEVAREPMFSRYLFVRMASDEIGQSWIQIRSTRGVSALVRFGEQPVQVDDALIEDLRQRENRQSGTPFPLFTSGDKVVITDGSLAGLEAIYDAEDGEGRAAVFIEILSRRLTMSLNLSGLRKAK